MPRKRLLKKETDSLYAKMQALSKTFDGKELDVADPEAASLLKILIATATELKKYIK